MYINDLYSESDSKPEISLGNNCSYTINKDRIQIDIGQISNNRQIGNISGTLSIELWALDEAYAGNYFTNAHCMANTMIGQIYGGNFLENCQYDLVLDNPSSGTWYLCLMMREYNGQNYETIDYCNFDIPYVIDFESTNVAEIETLDNKIEVTEVIDELIEKKSIEKNSKISLNSATEKQINEIKGVSKKLANLIISNRPFKSLEDLMKLKGVGKKLLEKILKQFKI